MFSRLYLHIPWCLSKCGYCAFNSKPLEPERLEQTCDLLICEMQHAAATFPVKQPLHSLYFGGGTPSLLSPEQVERLISTSRSCFNHAADVEITLEANPGTVDSTSLSGYVEAGITRLSLGAQSFNDHNLRLLGRRHTKAETIAAFAAARTAGFSSIGLDLICGLPGQNLVDWLDDLKQLLQLRPEHISVYGLSIEDGTPFAVRYPVGSQELPDDDLLAAMLELADNQLQRVGYQHYEIANFCLSGHQSQHNSGYWRRDGYLGIGPGAHSFLRQGWGIRWSNQSDYTTWAASVDSGMMTQLDRHELTRDEALSEALYLGLRMAEGISLQELTEQFSEDIASRFANTIRQLQQAALVNYVNGQLSLTNRGMLLSNQVFVKFV